MGTGDGGGPKPRESLPEVHGSPGATLDASAQMTDHSQALAEMFRTHHAAQVRFIAVRTGSVEDAKEIVQEAYARILALNRPGAISLLAGYLWRTAVNLARDRKRERAQRERFNRTALSLAEQRDHSAEGVCEGQERLAIVERAIGGLPANCVDAFVLHVLQGLKYEDVGRKMGISGEMARKHVARSLEYLQVCLDEADATRCAR